MLAVLPEVAGATIGQMVARGIAGSGGSDPRVATDMSGLLDDGSVAGGGAGAADILRSTYPSGGSHGRPAKYGYVTVEEIPPEQDQPVASTVAGDSFPVTHTRNYLDMPELYADWNNAERLNDVHRRNTSREYADIADIRGRFRSAEARLVAFGDLATQQVDIPLAAFVGANVTSALTLAVAGTAGLGTGGSMILDGVGSALSGSLYRRAAGGVVTAGQAVIDGATGAVGGLVLRPVAGYVGGKIQGLVDRIGVGVAESVPQKLNPIFAGDEVPYARTYRLEQGADGRWSTFDAIGNRFTAKGQYNFATIDGEIRVSPMRNGHYAISGGADAVDYAGSVQFGRGTTRGQLVQFSNDSGHYTPDPNVAWQSGFPTGKFSPWKR